MIFMLRSSQRSPVGRPFAQAITRHHETTIRSPPRHPPGRPENRPPSTDTGRCLSVTAREDALATFGRWCPAAFVVGGIGILGTSVVGTLDVAAVVESTPRLAMGPLLVGLWFVFVGLVGFHPRVADGSPRLSRFGVWTSAIAWVLWTTTLLATIGIDLTSGRTFATPGSWAPPLLVGAFGLALLSFLAYGIASTWSERPSRRLGILLLIPVVAFLGQAILLGSKILSGEVIAVLQLALGGVTAVVLVVVGYRLRHDTGEAAGGEARAEPTT